MRLLACYTNTAGCYTNCGCYTVAAAIQMRPFDTNDAAYYTNDVAYHTNAVRPLYTNAAAVQCGYLLYKNVAGYYQMRLTTNLKLLHILVLYLDGSCAIRAVEEFSARSRDDLNRSSMPVYSTSVRV